MSEDQSHGLSLLMRFSAATLLISIACGFVVASLLAPINEPFWGWSAYVREWIAIATYSTPVIYFIISVVTVGYVWSMRSRSGPAMHIYSGLYRHWWLLPVILLWAAARFIAAPVDDSAFSFSDGSPKTLGTLTSFAVAISGMPGSMLFAAVIGGLVTRVLQNERRQFRRMCGLCPNCAYPIGTSEVCTECGATLPLPLGEGRGAGAHERHVRSDAPSPLTPLPEGEGNDRT